MLKAVGFWITSLADEDLPAPQELRARHLLGGPGLSARGPEFLTGLVELLRAGI